MAVSRPQCAASLDRYAAGRTIEAKRRDQETINELEEIVNGLLADKSELIQIARAYEQGLVAQNISESDVEYITSRLIPKLKEFLEKTAASQGESSQQVEEMIDLLAPLLSIETITVLQLIGFNFKRAIGEPLTDLVSQMITAKSPTDAKVGSELETLMVKRELAYVELAKDAEAYGRLMRAFGRDQP